MFSALYLIIYLAIASAIPDSTHNSLMDKANKVYPETQVSVLGYSLVFQVFLKEGPLVSESYYQEAVKVASQLSLKEIQANHNKSCDQKSKLDIFQVSFSELNTPNHIADNHSDLGSLWGIFDPHVKGNKDMIVVANHTYYSTHVIVAHEIAHYWAERLCISDYKNTSSEEFARTIERRYVDYYNSNL